MEDLTTCREKSAVLEVSPTQPRLNFMVLPTLAWVKNKAELSDVPLLCKEGRRGGSLFAAINS